MSPDIGFILVKGIRSPGHRFFFIRPGRRSGMHAGLLLPFLLSSVPASRVQEQAVEPDEGTVLLLSVPDVRQSTGYSCGAACLLAVLNYWGIDREESDLIALLGSTPESGTRPGRIVAVATSLGLEASLSQNLEIADLKQSLASRVPVIVAVQAWEGYDADGTWICVSPPCWDTIWDDGHYMVVIGIDSRYVYLEDPSLLGTRGAIPIREFLSRWHYAEPESAESPSRIYYQHLGIFIRGEEPAIYPRFSLVC